MSKQKKNGKSGVLEHYIGDKKPPLTGGLHPFFSRLGKLEAFQEALTNEVHERLGQFEKEIFLSRELILALVDIAGGEERVEEALRARRDRADNAMVEKAESEIQKRVVAGELAVSETVRETSLIVGRETNTETGEVSRPGRFELHYTEMTPEAQRDILGLKVGDEFELDDHFKVEILGIYTEKEDVSDP